jgi:bifunctional non-homologous end joining protein LigD
LRTRGGADATTWFPEIPATLTGLPAGHHIIDGEMCVLVNGRSDFVQLHERAMRRRWYPGAPPVVLCAFDLLVHAGTDIRGKPIEERQARLAALVSGLPGVLYVSATDDGAAMWAAVIALQLEGMVAKRVGSAYVAGPSRDWLKIKRPGATLPGFKRDI